MQTVRFPFIFTRQKIPETGGENPPPIDRLPSWEMVQIQKNEAESNPASQPEI